jgi:branched-chain amino acid transport system substrate-binding protein
MKRYLPLFVLTLSIQPTAAEAQETSYRIGATVPLTGDYATYGSTIRDGVELAIDDLREEGIRLQAVYEDVPAPGLPAVTAIRKLTSQDQIHALVANFWNPAIPAMAPTINKLKLPAFHTAAVDDAIAKAGHSILSTNTTVKAEASAMARYARQSLQAKTACVLYIGTAFGENFARHFRTTFEQMGGKVLYYDLTALGETDVRAVLTRMRTANPDVFFAAYFGTNLGTILRRSRELGMTMPILSVYEAEDRSVIETAGKYANDTQFFISEPLEETASQIALARRFRERFGYAPYLLSRNAYDATMLAGRALSACRGEPLCTTERLYNTKRYEGFSGQITITEEGAADKEFVLKTIANQQFVRVSNSITLQATYTNAEK